MRTPMENMNTRDLHKTSAQDLVCWTLQEIKGKLGLERQGWKMNRIQGAYLAAT